MPCHSYLLVFAPTFSFSSASLSGRPGRFGGGTEAALAEVASAIVEDAGLVNREIIDGVGGVGDGGLRLQWSGGKREAAARGCRCLIDLVVQAFQFANVEQKSLAALSELQHHPSRSTWWNLRNMGAPPVTVLSSLDRLKALDALPDLSSQLREANHLCDHQARAEMIVKWLMTKLKTSDEAREHDQSWILFTSAVHILPPRRIAVLSSGLVPLLQQTWAMPELSDATIYAIAQLFAILLKLGQGADGAAIRSMLSVKGDIAAKMCGDWYRHVHNFSQTGRILSVVDDALLNPALEVWDLRAHMEMDDVSFNQHCLVFILLLLTQLRKANASSSAKRKRGQEMAINITPKRYSRVLEALIARHTVLPARTVFNRKHEQQPRRKHGQRPGKQPTIDERLSTLKEASSTSLSGTSIGWSLCLVLDVALRSISTPSPRHRFAERPWIETLFAALCNCVSDQNRLFVNGTLIELLETVRLNGLSQTGLSAQTLTGLFKTHAMVEDDRAESIDWRLVAKIVQLDPDVLTNLAITEPLFSAISDIEDQQLEPLAALWRDEVIVPTMKAFAQSRSLVAFLDIWHKQLLRSRNSKSPSVWESLGTRFAEILEEKMLPEQIIAQIQRFYLPVSVVAEDQSKLSDDEVASALSANIVLLEALLIGTRSDDLVLNLQDKLDQLFHTSIKLANLKGFKSTLAMSCHYWSLLTRAFEIWFPHWAAKQDTDDAVKREGMAILSSKAFKNALTLCSTSEFEQELHESALTVRTARGYVASLCACFQQYGDEEGCVKRCVEAMKQVVKHKVSAASILAHRPVLFSSLDPGTRNELISSPLLLAAATRSGDNYASTPIQALLASSRGTGKQQTVEDVVSIILKDLSHVVGAGDERLMVSTLTNIDTQFIEQTQRVNIIDTIAQLPEVPADQDGAAQLQARFALLLKLLELPCYNSQLLTDSKKLWDLASLVRDESEVGSGGSTESSNFDSPENLQLLEGIARCVLGSLLATQDREKSQKVLVQFSQLIRDIVKLGAKGAKLSAHRGQMTVIKVAIAMLETSAREDIKARLVHRVPKTVRAYLDTLIAECSSYSGEKGGKLTASEGKAVVSILQALLDVPDSIVELSGIDLADHAKQIYKLTRDFMSPSRMNGDESLQSRLFVVCFQLVCKHAPQKINLTTIAEEILERDLKATGVVIVLLAYEAAFTQSDAEWKLSAITTLTTEASSQRPSSLFLHQAAIKALTKEDTETIPSSKDLIFQTLRAAKAPESLLAVRRTALQSLALVFKDKTFLISQYTIEQTLAVLQELLSLDVASDVGALYLTVCHVLMVILAHHRSRLQGRFHLLISLLQQLTSHLFNNGSASVPQARSLAKLLESFCNPPALRYRRGGKPSDLVDEAKRAQAHAGQFAPYLLHHYCGCVLTGSLGESVREALLPGLWAVIEAMETYNEDAIRVLSSAANNSERAVLRSVYEEWKRTAKWEGV